MTPDERREYIERLVDTAPPLSELQRARLAILLRPSQPAPLRPAHHVHAGPPPSGEQVTIRERKAA